MLFAKLSHITHPGLPTFLLWKSRQLQACGLAFSQRLPWVFSSVPVSVNEYPLTWAQVSREEKPHCEIGPCGKVAQWLMDHISTAGEGREVS